jgi:hypothetical protein
MLSDKRTQEIRKIVEELQDYGEQAQLPRVSELGQKLLDLLELELQPEESFLLQQAGFIPIRKAMKISGRSRNTVKNWARKGLLQGYTSRSNGELFVNKEALEFLLTRKSLPDFFAIQSSLVAPDISETKLSSDDSDEENPFIHEEFELRDL